VIRTVGGRLFQGFITRSVKNYLDGVATVYHVAGLGGEVSDAVDGDVG